MKSFAVKFVAASAILFLAILDLLFFFPGRRAGQIAWGLDFSQQYSQALGLDWRQNYLAFLRDLGVKNLRLSTAWDLLEPLPGQYSFVDLDWQIEQAEKAGARIILAAGLKTPRWPECHFPAWVRTLPEEERQLAVLRLWQQITRRYRERAAIWAWQVENEPLLPFGRCPEPDPVFLRREVGLVKFWDGSARPVIVSDSGEWSFWFRAAQMGDIVGTTLYRQTWVSLLDREFHYPFPPAFYRAKAWLVKKIFHKPVINVELQGEPWGARSLGETSWPEQEKIMNLERFRANIEFATKTGLDTFYLWGGEWWYWLKEKQGEDSFWQEAKAVFAP